MAIALVIAGGSEPDSATLKGVRGCDFVVAADSGVRVARTNGLSIDFLVGDLDSVTEGDLAWAKAEGAQIVSVPAEKDFTDLELAFDQAVAEGATEVIVVGVDGGRIDHELGNWAVICAPRPLRTEVRSSGGVVVVLHGEFANSVELEGEPGDLISLVARNCNAEGVSATGLKWPLTDCTLSPWESRGISNEFISSPATISVDRGTLLVARPLP